MRFIEYDADALINIPKAKLIISNEITIESWPFSREYIRGIDVEMGVISHDDLYEIIESLVNENIGILISYKINELTQKNFSVLYRSIATKAASEQKTLNFGIVYFEICID